MTDTPKQFKETELGWALFSSALLSSTFHLNTIIIKSKSKCCLLCWETGFLFRPAPHTKYLKVGGLETYERVFVHMCNTVISHWRTIQFRPSRCQVPLCSWTSSVILTWSVSNIDYTQAVVVVYVTHTYHLHRLEQNEEKLVQFCYLVSFLLPELSLLFLKKKKNVLFTQTAQSWRANL